MPLTRPAVVLLLLGLALSGCLEEAQLTERLPSGTQARGPDCASCHAYPLKDSNHVVHLFEVDSVSTKSVNGRITCVDCHATAMASRPQVILDSVYADLLGNEYTTYDVPGLVHTPLFDSLRFSRIDTLRHDRPVPSHRPGNLNLLTEWVTSLAHMNGTVDVVFHPRVSDTAGKWPGRRAEFNRPRETCSAVACHPGSASDPASSPHWRFAAPSKGLSLLKGDSGAVP